MELSRRVWWLSRGAVKVKQEGLLAKQSDCEGKAGGFVG